MSVQNEVDRMWLGSRKMYINAVVRDVAFLPIPCKLCGEDATSGFTIIVTRCRDSFHYDCFMKALRPRPQELEVCAEAFSPTASIVSTAASSPASTLGSPTRAAQQTEAIPGGADAACPESPAARLEVSRAAMGGSPLKVKDGALIVLAAGYLWPPYAIAEPATAVLPGQQRSPHPVASAV
eukprot:CAMPEP_0183579786 /NCGR_PEP_ID=MMETSP0371-20130417/144526_1 /TAXON_ID=268820 /ORGANISM="Peridinium aciculiferum, Strain PAER-2" /LENGTH=180 /DNA_ID=CAMNT_0025790325 /DNA_START=56 /DNA_END=596 /DNA_ORIENTATION=-